MNSILLDGKVLAAKLKEKLTAEVAHFKNSNGQVPRVISLLVGDDPAALSYISSQEKAAGSLGVHYQVQHLAATASQDELLELIEQLNSFEHVHGIIINKPLPAHLDFNVLINAVEADKDIEGMNLTNLGRLFLGANRIIPCTPASVMAHLHSTGIDLKGKEAVIIGRSDIVGKPLSILLLQENVTITVCHSGTVNLQEHVKRADIVIAAIGKPLFVKGDWVKQGAIVIDVGINRVDDKIVGDVDFSSVSPKASFITPVPGGVGPVTSVMLMHNACEAFKTQTNTI